MCQLFVGRRNVLRGESETLTDYVLGFIVGYQKRDWRTDKPCDPVMLATGKQTHANTVKQ